VNKLFKSYSRRFCSMSNPFPQLFTASKDRISDGSRCAYKAQTEAC
jgi:hypothetical protein